MTDGARFRVDRTLTLSRRPHLLLLGEIVEGEVRIGMVAAAGPAHRPSFRQPVDAIEFADDIRTRRSWLVLGFRSLDAAELRRWMEMGWAGLVLDIRLSPILHPCPCCAFRTLLDAERGSHDICGTCGWEDDGVQLDDPDYRGGANEKSLNEARSRFRTAYPASFRTNDG